jgi:hypothetical protein
MWRTSYNSNIQRVEVERATKSTVWLLTNLYAGDGRRYEQAKRESRIAERHSYHDTWEEAHNLLMKRAEREVELARLQLQRVNGNYGRIKGMKPLEGTP